LRGNVVAFGGWATRTTNNNTRASPAPPLLLAQTANNKQGRESWLGSAETANYGWTAAADAPPERDGTRAASKRWRRQRWCPSAAASSATAVCTNCQNPPAAGSKLQLCSACRNASYCSEVCQKEAWPEHKLVCDSLRAMRERLVAGSESSSGSFSRSVRRSKNYFLNLFDAVPGLTDKVQFLAWKHRDETPVINIVVSSLSEIAVTVLPRALWEDATNWSGDGDVITTARAFLSSSSFHPDNRYLLYFTDTTKEYVGCISMGEFDPFMQRIHSSALMTLTADDFAAEVLRRQTAPNAVYVRLTGLVGAAHLNGREGVLAGRDPNNSERFGVTLEDGKVISVRSVNYETVRRPKLFNEEF
jgi:hypothetical protein